MIAPLAPSRRTSELLWSITGTHNDALAHQKFAVFALVCSLLVPNAAKAFHRALKHERFHKRKAQEFPRVLRSNARFNFRLNKLADALVKSLRPQRHEGGSVFPPPCWAGEPRPKNVRRVRIRTNFPSADYLRHLVSELGYEGCAAFAALSRAHTPWTKVTDRRHANATPNYDNTRDNPDKYSSFVSVHPYCPAAPSRRTKVGGGLTKQQVQEALDKKRWDTDVKKAVFEIVFRRRSALEVSNESGRAVEILHVYASRLRREIRADLRDEEKVA